MADEIVNKVAESGIITIDPENYYVSGERTLIDIKDLLWQGMVLKEKEFREFIKSEDWSRYQDKLVAVYCSADAIVPAWTYMLMASALQPYAKKVIHGTVQELEKLIVAEQLNKTDWKKFQDARVVIKGCGEIALPENIFVEITFRLQPFAKSIMYGEPCSTVPVFKRK